MTNKEQNEKLLESFLMSLEADNYSEHSIRSFKTSICQFLEFYGDKDILDIDYPDAEDFKNYLHALKRSPNTISSRISAMRDFCKYIRKRVRKAHPSFENVFADLSLPPKKLVRKKVIWAYQEVLDLVNLLYEKEKYTEALLLALDLFSGRRRSELLRFKVEDFDDKNLICDNKLYRTDEIKTKGRNGGKFIQCYVHSDIKPFITKYCEVNNISEGLLFTNYKKDFMGTIAKRINKFTDKHFHWHAGRHTFATKLYNDGVPEDIIVEIVGWSDKEMLKIYNDNTREQKIIRYYEKEREA